MLDVRALKAEIVKKGYTQTIFCEKIGMAHSTFVRKMKLKSVTTSEAEKMIEILEIEDPCSIFFAKNLTCKVKTEEQSELEKVIRRLQEK